MSNYNIDYLNTEWISEDGYKAHVVKYKNCTHILIRFEDGFEKIVTAQKLREGIFYRSKKVPQKSLNEYACFYYFSQVGFIQPDTDYMKKFGFKHAETFDMYQPDLKIAIEYDGMGHNFKKDHHKNIICKKNGIHIIRIREKQTGFLNDGIAEEYLVKNSWLSKDLADLVQRLIKQYDSTITVDFKRDKKKIFGLYTSSHISKETKRTIERHKTKADNKNKRDRRDKYIVEYTKDHPNMIYPEIARELGISESMLYRALKNSRYTRYEKCS